jgi:hypothetical protein
MARVLTVRYKPVSTRTGRSIMVRQVLALSVAVAAVAAAQTPPPAGGAPAPAPAAPATPPPAAPSTATNAPPPLPAGNLGLIVYPSKGQDRNQQSQDEVQCYAWAQQQTGVDPATLKADPNTAAAVQKQASAASTGTAVKSTAGGAAAGAAIGAISGDSGKGAAIGATAGAMRGVAKKAKSEKQAAAQGQQAAQAEAQGKFDTFKKAMTACLSGRGYSVQ